MNTFASHEHRRALRKDVDVLKLRINMLFHFRESLLTSPEQMACKREEEKKKKESMPTSNHMCNKWCWLCSCGVTTDGAVMVLPQNAYAHFRSTLHTAPVGTPRAQTVPLPVATATMKKAP